MFLAECPIDTAQGDSAFVKNLCHSLALPFFYCHASGSAFIGKTPYSGRAILSEFAIEEYLVTPYTNPKLSIIKENWAVMHIHDKFIQTGKLHLPEGKMVSILNTPVLPITIFGKAMGSTIGKEIFSTLETVIDRLPAPMIIAGDFNTKDYSLQQLFTKYQNTLQSPTATLHTSIVDERYKGAQLACSKDLRVKACWSIPTESDHYVIGITVVI